jgi:hypothetical protein
MGLESEVVRLKCLGGLPGGEGARPLKRTSQGCRCAARHSSAGNNSGPQPHSLRTLHSAFLDLRSAQWFIGNILHLSKRFIGIVSARRIYCDNK